MVLAWYLKSRIFFRMLVKGGSVSHDAKLGTFTVLGSTGKPHVVKVFPLEYCSCPSTTTCYHILAVKLSLGIVISEGAKKVNLTQLRWNMRAKNDKKSGRKRPRPGDANNIACIITFFLHLIIGDYDLSPAPDSILNSQLSDTSCMPDTDQKRFKQGNIKACHVLN